MPASPKPPRTPPKPRKPIRRKTPLPRTTTALVRRTRIRPISAKRQAEIRQRTDVTRPGVLRRDGYRCRACGFRASPGVTIWSSRWLEVHEEPPRSLGGNPNDPADCITLCATYNGDGCHQQRTANRLAITKGPEGCNSPVTFTQGDRTWTG